MTASRFLNFQECRNEADYIAHWLRYVVVGVAVGVVGVVAVGVVVGVGVAVAVAVVVVTEA